MPLRVCLTNEYSNNVSNLIFGTSVSANDLEYVALVPFPYSFIRGIHKPLAQGKDLVVYNQAYEKGWLAFCGLLPCQAEHVVVNNWANGWVFDNPVSPSGAVSSVDLQNITIIFWPQVLEYLGFFALGVWVVFCCKHNID